MNCEKDKALITAWINNELSAAERAGFEAHLESCAECRQELKAEMQIWSLLESMPVPEASTDMPVRFNAMLEEYKESAGSKKQPFANLLSRLQQLWQFQPKMQLAYSIILVVAGVGLGIMFKNQGADKKEIASLSSQVHEMKEMMMLSLLENPSASERIRGVSYTNEIKGTNKEVIEALLSTLNNDPNVNVRLVTLEALSHYANIPEVREGLVQSIVLQESPLVQSAMADVMLKLQEKKAVQPLKKLLQQKDLNRAVRNKIEQTITSIS